MDFYMYSWIEVEKMFLSMLKVILNMLKSHIGETMIIMFAW